MKHLIFLIDGTWLTPSNVFDNNTFSNIYKINLLLGETSARDGHPQIVFYFRGLGAVPGPMRYFAGGFAYGIKEEIEDVYINIAANFEEGDKIYLFGFSRGAVVARVVAALVARFGLLFPNKIEFFREIWGAYKNYSITGDPDALAKHRKELCWPASQVDFLGVFDTVYGGNHTASQLQRRLQFAGNKLSINVKNAIHILALDEQRPFFKPLLWEDSNEHPSLEQIWMPGVHGDIGGCYAADALGNASLLMMIERAKCCTELGFLEDQVYGIGTSLEAALEGANVSVNSEWSALWAAMCLGQKYTRKPPRQASHQTLHPIARKLSTTYINDRRKRHAAYYFDDRFTDLPLTDTRLFSG